MTEEVEDGAGRGEAAGHAEERTRGFERAMPILDELVDAARSAAETMLDDQKQRAAGWIGGIAEAMRQAGLSLERSENETMARYAGGAADQIEGFAQLIRNRRWREIAADGEDFARRRPMLFVLGAAATGFLAGRLLSVPSDRRQPKHGVPQTPDLSPHRAETDEITAAVSKLATRPAKVVGDNDRISAEPGTR